MPLASIRMTAAITGASNRNDMAAKLPAAAMTVTSSGGASRRARRTARIARPLPRASNGASGPRTRPRPTLAMAARSTPGTSTGCVPLAERPWAGTCPPKPGSRMITMATISPAAAQMGSDHHQGAPLS